MNKIIPEIRSPLMTKVVIKPILWSMYHRNAYQGPCRYGQGYSLSMEFDKEQTLKEFERFKRRLDDYVPSEKAIVLEPEILYWHEDFVMPEAVFERALKQDHEIDFYLICGVRVSGYFTVEMGKRTTKAIGFVPAVQSLVRTDQADMAAHLLALGRKEVYPCYDMDDVANAVDILRIKKIMRTMKIFFPLKSSLLSFGCQSSYINLDYVRERFGTTFAHVNAEEIFSVMESLTEDELKECEEMAEKLVQGADAVHMPVEFIKNDYVFYAAIKKMMAVRDCNAFTIPCFEVCATRELNKRHFTFCLAKSLFREEGIPSACAGDVGSVISNALMMAITNSAPYMGNTMVWERKENICRIHHDSPTRYMKGYDKSCMPYELVNFAMDGWGTTIRYDFNRDKGEKVTLINLSPDFKKVMIVDGTIVKCTDFLTPECTLAMQFKVGNANTFLKYQKYVGHHFSMVYGDWTSRIEEVAESFGLEVMKV